MMDQDNSIQSAAGILGMELKKRDYAEQLAELAATVNGLIQTDFNRLVTILYRMDISEKKLRQLVQDSPERDAGLIIAELMVEREAQKILSRKQFRRHEEDIDENEKW